MQSRRGQTQNKKRVSTRVQFGLLLSLLLLALACERENRAIGGAKSTFRASPEYTEQAEISKLPAPVHVASIAPTLGAAPIDGAEIYAKSCGACHQANGMGVPNVFPPLVNSPYVLEDEERLASIILYGLVGPIEVLGTTYNSAMAGLGGQFNDEELAAVATYVRTTWGNAAAPLEAQVFSEMREKWGTRGPFSIEELGAAS